MKPPRRDSGTTDVDDAERHEIVARAAADEIEAGMMVGLGSGSTAEAFIRELGRRVQGGLGIRGVATSDRSAKIAREFGIPVVTLDEVAHLDIGIDGADEIDPMLEVVKGRGGALLHEKLVALACQRFIIIATTEKLVTRLGTRMPLPVEVVPFGWHMTARRLAGLGLDSTLRTRVEGDHSIFVTDGGHFLLDCVIGSSVTDFSALAMALKALPGVVDHGLFLGMAHRALVVDPMGSVSALDRPPPSQSR